MRNHFDHYNCTIDGGINQFSIYLRSAYGSALFDINNELTERELNIIKKFTEQVLKKKSYVAKGSRLFVKENNTYVPRAPTKRSTIPPIDAIPWRSFKQLIDKMDKRDLFLQACEIIEKTKELHPVISGLFIFAALIAEATVDDDENYLDKIKNIVDDDFGIEITTGPLSFEVLNEAVDHFVKAKKEYFVDNDEDEAAEISSELDSVFDDTENEEDFFGASFEDSRNEVTKFPSVDYNISMDSVHLNDLSATSKYHEDEEEYKNLSSRFEKMFRMAIKMKAELEDAKLKNAELIEYNQKLQDINLHQSNTIREEMVKNVEKEAEIVRLNGNITILQARIADCISTNNQLKKDADIERERINEMVKENVQLKAVMEDDKQKNFIVKDLEYRYNQWKGDGIKLSFEHLAFQVGVKESFFAQNLSSSILDRIFCQSIRSLSLENSIIKYSEYKRLVASPNLKDVQLRFITVKDKNERLIEVDQLLKDVLNVNSFVYSFKSKEVEPETAQNISQLLPFSNLQSFWLFNIEENFDLKAFGEFIKKNPNVSYTLWFRCSIEFFAELKRIQKTVISLLAATGELIINKY